MTGSTNGTYSNIDCNEKHPFICNIVKKIDYICARGEDNHLQRVFEYSSYTKYTSNRTAWNEGYYTLFTENNYWYLTLNENQTIGRCHINGTQFILPTECSPWEYTPTNTSLTDLTFADCDC